MSDELKRLREHVRQEKFRADAETAMIQSRRIGGIAGTAGISTLVVIAALAMWLA